MLTSDFLARFGAMVFGAALAVAAPATWAQTTSESSDQTGSDTIELSLGEEADPQVGQSYAKEIYDDWEMRCLRTENPAEDPCQMYQLVNDKEGNPVAEVSMFRLPEGGQAKAGATVVVPLETALQKRLTIQIDGNKAKQYPFSFCNPLGCYARIGLTEEDIALYQRGAVAKVVITAMVAPNDPVELDVSLKGFTKAFQNASVVQQ